MRLGAQHPKEMAEPQGFRSNHAECRSDSAWQRSCRWNGQEIADRQSRFERCARAFDRVKILNSCSLLLMKIDGAVFLNAPIRATWKPTVRNHHLSTIAGFEERSQVAEYLLFETRKTCVDNTLHARTGVVHRRARGEE